MKVNTNGTVKNLMSAPTEQSLQLPPSQYPFEVQLAPGQEAKLHGNIRFINKTHQALTLRVRFDLQKGYLVQITSDTASHSQYVPMNTTFSLSMEDGSMKLNEMKKAPSQRLFRLQESKV